MDNYVNDNRQRVLHIANDYLGTSLYKALINALNNRGIENDVFVPVKKGTIQNGMPDNSVVVTPCFNTIDRLLFITKQRKLIKEMQRLFDLGEYSCIHAHTLFSAGYAAYKLNKYKGIPYIVAVRNTDLNVFFKRMVYLRNTGVRIMEDAEKVIFLSETYKRTILRQYVPFDKRNEIDRKSKVIPNGISDFFQNNSSSHKSINKNYIRIIYVGDINENKNLGETIDACKILYNRGINCTYTIIGDFTDNRCKHILKEDFVKYIPRCEHEELINHYRENDIFVMPSHTETFGLVYAEAMSQGLPVIYTRGQGFDGQFPDGEVGYSVSDTDPKELADCIEKVIQEYDGLSVNATALSARFNWNDIASEYQHVYEDIKRN